MATIQSRDVSEETVRRLKARAAEQGLSLSTYLARELERIAERPSLAEMTARLRTRRATRLSSASKKELNDARAKR